MAQRHFCADVLAHRDQCNRQDGEGLVQVWHILSVFHVDIFLCVLVVTLGLRFAVFCHVFRAVMQECLDLEHIPRACEAASVNENLHFLGHWVLDSLECLHGRIAVVLLPDEK